MKSYIVFLTILLSLCYACTNKSSQIDNQQILNAQQDSISRLEKQNYLDSLKRDSIFAALSDTVFGKVRYGMNKSEFNKAYNEFKKNLKKDDIYDFNLAGYNFSIHGITDIESIKERDSYELEGIKTGQYQWTIFYKGKLLGVEWHSRDIGSLETVKYSLGKIVDIFEHKYGKPNINNVDRFNNQNTIAKWETSSRLIVFYYRELVGSERDDFMEKDCPYQYDLTIRFLDKSYKAVADAYIEDVLEKKMESLKKMQIEDSINNSKAL